MNIHRKLNHRPITLPILFLVLLGSDCSTTPAPWMGPSFSLPRTELTSEHLKEGLAPITPLDYSFLSPPEGAKEPVFSFSGTVTLLEATMDVNTYWSYPGGSLFPSLSVDLISQGKSLIPGTPRILSTNSGDERYWDVVLGPGLVWQEEGESWSRAALPLSLIGRYVGEVRNAVLTFIYNQNEISFAYLQSSQETAVLDAGQLGDITAMIPLEYQVGSLENHQKILADFQAYQSSLIPVRSLSEIDSSGRVGAHFDRDIWTNSSTSQGAVYYNGILYVHPPETRHGIYPFPSEMRHGVFSITKSLAGALALFYFAERYGEDIFDELITDYVPPLADLPEWQCVSFAHTLNMVTGTRAGESGELLYYPLELAPDSETAISNIAALGDYPEGPGERFNYATTNTFVLSYALQNYIESREGPGLSYWELVENNVLDPIGARGFGLLFTRGDGESKKIPILGLGAYPSLDQAAKIARLIEGEGMHEGRQILNRNKVREAFGRRGWQGYSAWPGIRYRHSFWTKTVSVDFKDVEVVYMEGLGDNRIIFLPNGMITFQFTDEFDPQMDELVRDVMVIDRTSW